MHKPTLIAIATAASLFAATAQAGGKFRGNDYDDDNDGYRGNTAYAQVLSSRPIYSQLRVSQPRQECFDERVVQRDNYGDYNRGVSNFDSTAGAVIGGLIGGAAGHQVSAGSGRRIATAIGAVIGASVGQNYVRENGYRRDQDYGNQVSYEQRCRTVSDSRYEDRLEGYDVTYRYQGQVYNTRLPYDPGNRLPVRVEVSPVRY